MKEGRIILLWHLCTQYTLNFPFGCPQSRVCDFALDFLVKIKTYFSQLCLISHQPGPTDVNGPAGNCLLVVHRAQKNWLYFIIFFKTPCF